MKQCPNGHDVSDNMRFCPTCGAEVVEDGTLFCTKCGNKRKGTEKFCPQCGTPYGEVPSPQIVQVHNPKSRKGLVIAVVCLLVLVLGGVAWYFLGNSKDKYSLEGLAKAVVEFDRVTDFHEGLAFFEKGKKVGVINKMGDIIVEPTYDSDMLLFDCQYKDGKAMVCKNGKFGFIDKNGKEIIPCKFDSAIPFSEGLAAIEKEGKYGFIDEKGQLAIPVIYENVNIFSGGLASVEKNGKYGYINKKGETVIPFTYDYGESFNGEVTIVNSDCIINKEGKVIKKYKSGFIRDFSEGLAVYEKEENGEIRYGFIDESGKLVIPQDYYSYRGCYGYFKDGYAVVYKYDAEKFGVIDKSGKTIIPFSFDLVADDYSEGLFRVCKNEKTGYYDNKGKCIIPCKFDNANPFSEGLAAVKQGNSGGFIDKLGNWVIPSIYDEVHSFSEGLAVVQKDGIFGFVDKEGNSTFDIQDEEVKKIVQAKIDEKERIRKEEEKRAEEVRRRLEEENQPQTKLFNIAQSGNFVWVNHWAYHDEVLYFYPIDKYSGMVSFVHYEDNFKVYSKALSFKTNYTVSSNKILFSFTKEHWSGIIAVNFKGIIQNDGGTVRIIRDNETNDKIKQHYVTRLRSDIGKDPL